MNPSGFIITEVYRYFMQQDACSFKVISNSRGFSNNSTAIYKVVNILRKTRILTLPNECEDVSLRACEAVPSLYFFFNFKGYLVKHPNCVRMCIF